MNNSMLPPLGGVRESLLITPSLLSGYGGTTATHLLATLPAGGRIFTLRIKTQVQFSDGQVAQDAQTAKRVLTSPAWSTGSPDYLQHSVNGNPAPGAAGNAYTVAFVGDGDGSGPYRSSIEGNGTDIVVHFQPGTTAVAEIAALFSVNDGLGVGLHLGLYSENALTADDAFPATHLSGGQDAITPASITAEIRDGSNALLLAAVTLSDSGLPSSSRYGVASGDFVYDSGGAINVKFTSSNGNLNAFLTGKAVAEIAFYA